MNLVDLVFLSVALGVDCLLVSFSQGLIFKTNKRLNSFYLALTMGLFQGIMPALSYFGTEFVKHYIAPYGRWFVFGIFMILGVKIILEAFLNKENKNIGCIDFKCLMGLGMATSIDALASGVSLKITETPIIISALLIGIGSFLMSGMGFWLGYFFKKLPSKALNILGGLILVFLAFKNL